MTHLSIHYKVMHMAMNGYNSLMEAVWVGALEGCFKKRTANCIERAVREQNDKWKDKRIKPFTKTRRAFWEWREGS